MKFLILFSQHIHYHFFRIEELESLAELGGINRNELWHEDSPRPDPESNDVFVYCHLPNEEIAKQIQKRSILIKSITEVWSEGYDFNEIIDDLTKNCQSLFEKHLKFKTWAYKFVSFNRTTPYEEILEITKPFGPLLSTAGKVDLKNPETLIFIAEDWQYSPIGNPKNKRKFFGRVVAQRINTQDYPCYWYKYKLTDRPILGPTTLDNELAFLMCNQAKIKPGMLIYDPFVGTGSILIAATHYGATCMGSDIDVRVLKGWGVAYKNKKLKSSDQVKTDIFENFKHYQLQLPDIIRADSANPMFRYDKGALSSELNSPIENKVNKAYYACFDAIITDPPYGIRAGARKAGHTKKHDNLQKDSNYIFPTSWYDSRNTIYDLLNLSSKLLIDGGVLVFLLLVEQEKSTEELQKLIHEDFNISSKSLQSLPAGMGRYLVTMKRKARFLKDQKCS